MSRFASRGQRQIHWQREGEGRPMVLIAGLGGGMRTFGTLPRRFARNGQSCLTLDPVGMPPSSALPQEFDFSEAARDVIAVLDAATIDSAALVGTSLGGKVALTAAALAPERVDALVMLASSAVSSARARRVYRFFEILAASLPPADFAEAIAPFLFGKSFHHDRAAVVDDILRSTRPTPEVRAMMVAQARALRTFDGSRFLNSIRCPTLCVAGLEDTLTGSDEVEATAALIDGAEFAAIEGAGHTLLLESARVFDLVREFVVGSS